MKKQSSPAWETLAQLPEFREIIAAKRRFIIPATIFFLLYYMSLPILVGYFPDAMSKTVWGDLNIAYLFAFSQFLMTFFVAALYMRVARRWDVRVQELLDSIDTH